MEKVTREIFRITISKVSKTEQEETETQYVKGGKIISWNDWYSLDDEEKKKYIKTEKPTGKIERDESAEKLYEQDLEELDIRDLAVYLNRVK